MRHKVGAAGKGSNGTEVLSLGNWKVNGNIVGNGQREKKSSEK